MGPDTFFCRTSQWGYATPRPPPRSSRDRNLQPGYKPQKSENYYQDDDHHYDKDQVTGAHSSSLETHLALPGASLEGSISRKRYYLPIRATTAWVIWPLNRPVFSLRPTLHQKDPPLRRIFH